MEQASIGRDAQVMAADGEVGRVAHVVVDPQTGETTHLVVRRGEEERLIPISAVASVEGQRVTLQGEAARYEQAPAFDHQSYQPLDDGHVRRVLDAPLGEARPYRLQLKEERLRIGKEEERAGTVRLRRQVIERLETVTVPVREERLVIEVVPGSGAVRIGDRVLREDETLEILLLQERVVVGKEVAVREDVVIRKELVEREERVEDTLRREELVVEERGDLVVESTAATGGQAR